MNRVYFTGTVSDMTGLIRTKNGQDYVRFTLDVKSKDRTDTPSINAYGETAREISNKLKKGNLIYFEGEFRTGKYGSYIVPVKIERMLGNRTEPENVTLSEEVKESSVIN